MGELAKLFWNICTFKANAEDVPASRFLLILCLGAYSLLAIAVHSVEVSIFQATIAAIIDLGILFGFTWSGLWIRDFLNRLPQAITSLTGTGVVLGLMSAPFVLWASQMPAENLASLPNMILTIIFFWNIAIIGHIFKNALSLPFWAGLCISVVYALTYFRVIRIILATS